MARDNLPNNNAGYMVANRIAQHGTSIYGSLISAISNDRSRAAGTGVMLSAGLCRSASVVNRAAPGQYLDLVIPCRELMGLEHILNSQGHDVAKLARVRGDDLDHTINHLLRVEVAER